MRAEQFLYVNYVLQYVNGHAACLPAGDRPTFNNIVSKVCQFVLFFFFFFTELSRSISDHYRRRCGNVTCSRPTPHLR